MGPICGVAVESGVLRIAYYVGERRVVESLDVGRADLVESTREVIESIDAQGPFESIIFSGRDAHLLDCSAWESVEPGKSMRTFDEAWALLAFVRSIEELADASDILVLDLGAHGTSAFSMNLADETVLWRDRTESFSGERLDDIVEGIVMGKGILPDPDGPESALAYRTFFSELKELLTTSAGVRAPDSGPMILDRAEYEDAVAPSIDGVLEWAATDPPEAVVLLGGVARSPLVQRRVRRKWQGVPVVVPESKSPAAEGAVIHAEAHTKTIPGTFLDAASRGEVDPGEPDGVGLVNKADAGDGPDPGDSTVADESSEFEDRTDAITIVSSATGAVTGKGANNGDGHGLAGEAVPEDDTGRDNNVDAGGDTDAETDLEAESSLVSAVAGDAAPDKPPQNEATESIVDNSFGLSAFRAASLGFLTRHPRRSRQTVLKLAAVGVSASVVVVALVFALFADFDNSPKPVINTDPAFESTLAEIAPTSSLEEPRDRPVGPVKLTDEQLYYDQYTYTGELYRPAVSATDGSFDESATITEVFDSDAELASP